MKKILTYLAIIFLAAITSCVDPFAIQNIQYSEILVVDGFLSTDAKQYHVALSRTSSINEKEFIPETAAAVRVEDKSGNTILFTEGQPGIYESPVFAGVPDEVYKLYITTQNGREYASEEVKLKRVPPIDSLYARYLAVDPVRGPGVQIYLDASDSSGNTRFFRWDYVETYEIHQPFPSTFVWLGGNNVVFRDLPVDVCWASDTLKNIFTRSTTGLEQDKVTAFPLRFIPSYDYAMRIKYSLLVHQFALSEEGFLFWDNLRIINESQGSLFDVQPGTLRGNVLSLTNPDEVVLGYFDASAVSEKRVFFIPQDFKADGYVRPAYLTSCDNFIPDEVPESQIGAYMQRNIDRMVISESVGAGPATFIMRPRFCCDCTNLGTNIKPSFWK